MQILLVDDDALVRESLSSILSSEDDIDVVGTAGNGEEALRFLKAQPAEVVLMDLRMPVMDGIEATAAIKRSHPQVKVLVLTTFRDFRHVHQALHAGADGYMLKNNPLEEQLAHIRSVHQGRTTISREALEAYTASRADEELSERENECMTLIAHGHSNKEIARRMFISEGTVRNLISGMLEKLMLRDRTQIAIYYWQSRHDS